MTTELRTAHQYLAVLKPVERIGPEVSRWVVMCVLDDAPNSPKIITYCFVQHHTVIKPRRHKAPTISLHHHLVLLGSKPSLYREVSKIPHRIVHSRILPIDEVNVFTHLHKVLRPRVIVTRSEGPGGRRECLTHRIRFLLNLFITLWQRR